MNKSTSIYKSSQAIAVAATSDGNYVVGGHATEDCWGTLAKGECFQRMFMIKIDPNGNLLKKQFYGLQNNYSSILHF